MSGRGKVVRALIRWISHPSDSIDEKDNKFRLLLLSLATVFLQIVILSVVLFASGISDGNRNYCSSVLGLSSVICIVSIALQFSTKRFFVPFLLATIVSLLTFLLLSAPLDPSGQGGLFLVLATTMPPAGYLVAPLNDHVMWFVLGETILLGIGFVVLAILQAVGSVFTPTPLDTAEGWVVAACVCGGCTMLLWAVATQERARAIRHHSVLKAQKLLEERLAFALEQVRYPTDSILTLAQTEHPPHPSVTAAAVLLKQSVDDVETLVGFNVAFINFEPFIVRQVFLRAVSEMKSFFGSTKLGASRDEGDGLGARGGSWSRDISLYLDPLVPTAAAGDSRRLMEVLLECMWSAVRRSRRYIFVDVSLVEGPQLKVLIGDDGRLLSPDSQRRLLASAAPSMKDASVAGRRGLARAAQLLRLMLGEMDCTTVQGSKLFQHHTAFVDTSVEYNVLELKISLRPPSVPSSIPLSTIDNSVLGRRRGSGYKGGVMSAHRAANLRDPDADEEPSSSSDGDDEDHYRIIGGRNSGKKAKGRKGGGGRGGGLHRYPEHSEHLLKGREIPLFQSAVANTSSQSEAPLLLKDFIPEDEDDEDDDGLEESLLRAESSGGGSRRVGANATHFVREVAPRRDMQRSLKEIVSGDFGLDADEADVESSSASPSPPPPGRRRQSSSGVQHQQQHSHANPLPRPSGTRRGRGVTPPAAAAGTSSSYHHHSAPPQQRHQSRDTSSFYQQHQPEHHQQQQGGGGGGGGGVAARSSSASRGLDYSGGDASPYSYYGPSPPRTTQVPRDQKGGYGQWWPPNQGYAEGTHYPPHVEL